MRNIRLETQDNIATLTLSRPKSLNSLTLELMDELDQALREVRDNHDIRVLLLTGSGRAFSSGIDLALLNGIGRQYGVDEVDSIVRKWQESLSFLEELPQITIAVINGLAYGGAVELALCCDFRFASSKALFGMPEVKFGIIPDLGGIPRLVRLVGAARAKEIILRARNFSSMEALRLGLVNRVAEPGDLIGQARSWAAFFDQAPAPALKAAKSLINSASFQSLQESLDSARTAQLELVQTADFRRALETATQEPEPQ